MSEIKPILGTEQKIVELNKYPDIKSESSQTNIM